QPDATRDAVYALRNSHGLGRGGEHDCGTGGRGNLGAVSLRDHGVAARKYVSAVSGGGWISRPGLDCDAEPVFGASVAASSAGRVAGGVGCWLGDRLGGLPGGSGAGA